MSLIRGRGLGLEVHLAGWDFDTAIEELSARLSERPEFYRGAAASVARVTSPSPPSKSRRFGRSSARRGSSSERSGRRRPAQELARRRAMRPKSEAKLSDSARSLVADFAGARADIAERRKRGESSVRRANASAAAAAAARPALQVAPPPPPARSTTSERCAAAKLCITRATSWSSETSILERSWSQPAILSSSDVCSVLHMRARKVIMMQKSTHCTCKQRNYVLPPA